MRIKNATSDEQETISMVRQLLHGPDRNKHTNIIFSYVIDVIEFLEAAE